MKHSHYLLDFEGAEFDKILDPDIRDGASAAALTGNNLWVGNDENISLQRLTRQADNTFAACKTYHLKDFIDLPSLEDEMDIEGMDYDGKYLWIVGSHSYKRSNIKGSARKQEKEVEKLCQVTIGPNRCILARIPCFKQADGQYELAKTCPDPDNPDKTLWAATLKHGKKSSQLTRELANDLHLGSFIKIPGKDNGLDIEGLAAFPDKLYLGLRGPVLRGWAAILEIRLKETKPEKQQLKLKKLDNGHRYRKFFVDLEGMGIREMAGHGQDILILAGPTMDLDGSMAIYRWKDGSQPQPDRLIAQEEISRLVDIPLSQAHGKNKAEGLALLDDSTLLVLYDSPGNHRLKKKHAVLADCFKLEPEK